MNVLRQRIGCLLAAGLVLACAQEASIAESVDFSAWTGRQKITFGGYTAGRPSLTNFPALVVLADDSNGVNFVEFKADAADLRFTDASKTNELNFEIETWDDANHQSWIWVQVPVLTNNAVIYAYWGKPDAEMPPCTTNGATWTDGFVGVWHLSEGGTGTRYDSTSNSCGATPTGFSGVESVTGVIGRADQLNGSSKYLNVPDSDLHDLGQGAGKQWTVSTWFRSEGADISFQPLVGKYGANSGYCDYMLFTSTHTIRWETGISSSPGTWVSAVEPSRSQWHHAVGMLVATGLQSGANSLYVDGRLCGTSNYTTKVAAQALPLRFGYTSSSYYYEGALDEVRIENVARCSNWVWASYMTVASNHVFSAGVVRIRGSVFLVE